MQSSLTADRKHITLYHDVVCLPQCQLPCSHVRTVFFVLILQIIYVAPMKALVAEMVGNFSKRLEPYGIKVGGVKLYEHILHENA